MNEEDINETKRENANKSLRIIAEQRNSPSLLESLESGNFSETEMDFSQAYALLGISDMTIDDDLVLSSYTSSIHEVPAQSGNYKRALAAIAKSRKSALLAAEAGVNIGSPDQHSLAEWPVGLENIGNTCYLNSLLQFYFTITPLRELVLNFDKYKMDVENADLSKKQVGSRKVLKREIVRAQAFVKELQGLFESMINAPKRCVKPRLELGQLVFFSSRDEEVRRQSILSGKRPNLKDITGSASGSLPASSPVEANQQEHLPPYSPSHLPTVEEATESEESRRISASSDGTLVEAPVPDTPGDDFMIIDSIEKQQTQIFEDKENLAPVPEMLERPATPEPALKPLEESSPSRINEQRAQSPTKELLHDSDYTMSPQQTYNSLPPPPAQPARPPPIPPRQKPEENNHMKKAEVEMGAQQDVGEVLGNVLFQLQCAIKPESIDSSGEQIDTVKNLFFGKQKNHITNKKGEKRTKEEFFSDIKIDVASGARDIYDALDATFDMQEVEVEGGLEPQYTTISSLPPVMQILIQRVQFDAVKKTTYKSNNHLGLQETIYMDRYMEDGVPDLDQRRQERWAWRKELVALIEQRDLLKKSQVRFITSLCDHLSANRFQAGLEMPDVLRCAADFLQQCSEFDSNTLNIQPEIIEFLERAAEHTRTQLSDLESQIQTLQTKISTQFADLRSLPYRLHSVFIHRGESNSGHYWIYIYDFSRGIWRKYNDETVTQVSDPKKEIFEEDPGLVLKNRPATPYFLVYLKDEAKDKLQAPVLREITEEGEDTVMDVDGDGEVGADANYSSVSNWVSEQQAQKAFVPVNPFGGVGGPSRTTIGENDDEGPVNTDW
jgi:ubiquitin carboxyl-terminal hydrolase 25/28